MPQQNEQERPSVTPELRRALSFSHLFIFGLVSMAPVAAFTMYGFVYATSGGAIVLAYLIGASGIMLTALSFAQMASVAAQSGSVYGYAKFALGGSLGFLGGWAMLLDYVLLASLTAVYGALYLFSALPQIPQLGYLLGFLALLLASGITGATLSTKFDFGVLLAQLGFGAVFILFALMLSGPGAVHSPLSHDLLPGGVTASAVLGGAALTVITFLGFDAISTLAEEVTGDNPGRRIGQATVLAVAAMLVLFILVSWLLTELAEGLTLEDPATAAFGILAQRLPALATPLALISGLAVGVGVCQACHTGATRVTFAMARDGRLPQALAWISPGFRTPLIAMALTLAVIASISVVALDQAEILAGLVSFGALSGFVLVNVSVIAHFGVRLRSRAWLAHWIAPLLGIAVVVYIMTGINPLALKLGLGWMAAGCVIYWLQRGPAARAAASARP